MLEVPVTIGSVRDLNVKSGRVNIVAVPVLGGRVGLKVGGSFTGVVSRDFYDLYKLIEGTFSDEKFELKLENFYDVNPELSILD